MALVLSSSIFMIPAQAKTEEEFKKEIAKLEQQIANNNNRINAEKESIDDLQKEIDLMQDQMDIYNEKIRNLNLEIAEKDDIINGYQKDIDALQAEIDRTIKKQEELEKSVSSTYELLGERMCSAYMSGETSTLEILFGAEDFQDFLTRLELLKRISDHDTQMVSGLQKSISELDESKEKLASDRSEVEQKQSTVQEERNAIASVRNTEQRLRNDLNSKQGRMESKYRKLHSYIDSLGDANNKYQQEIERQKEAYSKQKEQGMESGSGSLDVGGNSQFTQSSKGMIFPLQYSSAYINSPYGSRNGKMHRGIDMITRGGTGNTFGKQIRCVADGVVYSADIGYNGGWGNNVYINHGNGVYTRYAHCSDVLVRPGQKVKQGQVIALVGNSGRCRPTPTAQNPHAGAHLHFEVSVNGNRVDPTSWIPAHAD